MVEEALALARSRGLDALPLAEAAGIAAPMLASPEKPRVVGAIWRAVGPRLPRALGRRVLRPGFRIA
ncbi:hypothetical protein ACFFYR_07190 [Paraburkholderia dipogonis]|uniref:hypothetical protein n=1 Tax=Paraburkholderia dipogonis TaxID=1211383 RepID=UPI0035ED2D20